MNKAIVTSTPQPIPSVVLRIDQGLSKADAPEFAGLTVGNVSVIPSNRPVLDLVTQELIDHPSHTDNPHGVTAAQVGADPAGTANGAITAHLGAFDHDFIEHANRAELDTINQELRTNSGVAFNAVNLPSGNVSLLWAGGSMLYEQTSAAGNANRMLYRPRGDTFEVLTQNGQSFIASISLARSFFFTPVGMGASAFTPGAHLQINAKDANTKCLILKGYTGQAQNLLEIRNSSDETQLSVSSNYWLNVGNGTTGTIKIGDATISKSAGEGWKWGSGLIPSIDNTLYLGMGSAKWGVIRIGDAYPSYIIGQFTLGGPTPNAAAQLDIQSTTKGFLPPRMSTTQKSAIESPPEGLVVYDTTLHKLCIYTTKWETITSA